MYSILLLSLGACRWYPPPDQVPFPDDPRVLHGSWEMVVTGLLGSVDAFYLDAKAENLVMWESSAPARAYQADGAGDYLEVDASAFTSLLGRHFEPTLDAVVSLVRSGSSVSIRVVPLAGAAATNNVVGIPTGTTVRELAAGSGRAFMLLERAGGEQELQWWDSLTGEHGGTLALPLYSDGVHFTANGRAVLLWDLDGWLVRVIDTADPGQLLTVGLGACRSEGTGEVSVDGRWFVFANCLGELQVADLSNLAAGSSPLGVKRGGGLAFAADSSELVWIDTGGAVRALDVATRQQQVLLEVSDEEKVRLDLEWAWWQPPLYLNRGAELLAMTKDDGRVTLIGVGSQPTSVALPRPEFDVATLEVVAVPGEGWPDFNQYYTFSGSADIAGDSLLIAGSVGAPGIHDYVPSHAGLEPQILQPRLTGNAELWVDGEDGPRYTLSFETFDRRAVSYEGQFYTVAGPVAYLVRLRRVAP